jgi:hypothetical protein
LSILHCKTPSTPAKAGRANIITSAISPNSKRNKLDSNKANAVSAQSCHHQLTLFWLSKVFDPNENGFNWPIMKQIDNKGEFAIEDKLYLHEKKSIQSR